MAGTITQRAVPCVDIPGLLGAEDRLVIDLRSPGEFAVDHVPGALSIPLFDDVERAVIGTLYRRKSPQAAFEKGREVTQGRIDALVGAIAEAAGWEVPGRDLPALVRAHTEDGIGRIEGELVPQRSAPPRRPVILHCWRGGLRSRSVVAFLRELGLERAVALEGGYRAWRTHVRARLEDWEAPPTFVLRGLTGVGKTLILRELERIRPGWTCDLEGLAGHRSSILGMVGLEPCTQKTFETRLATRLAAGFPGPCVLEGESRKVGDAILPPRVWSTLQGGVNVRLDAPVERRVEVLMEDYLASAGSRDQLRGQLPFLEERLGPTKWKGKLVELLDAGREPELVEILLERYYDPLYRHSEGGRAYAAQIDATDPAEAARSVAEFVEGTFASPDGVERA